MWWFQRDCFEIGTKINKQKNVLTDFFSQSDGTKSNVMVFLFTNGETELVQYVYVSHVLCVYIARTMKFEQNINMSD